MTSNFHQILISPEDSNYRQKLDALLAKKAPAGRFAGYKSKGSKAVLKILRTVAKQGDEAVCDYTRKFDNEDFAPAELKLTQEDLETAHKEIDLELLESIRKAIKNVETHQSEIFTGKGKSCSGKTGIRYTPIKRVGLCIPGASAPLPSTVIMTAVPALVAGVKPENIIVVSPPRYKPEPNVKGTVHPVTLAVCYELGISEVYRVGGAQAVAALASDKGTIPKVDKIVGPGNKWVQTAKKMVSGDYVAIDSIMGPSEVLIIADESANPAWIAADMLSQAEHASDSSAILLTDSKSLAKQVMVELDSQISKLSREKDARDSLLNYSSVVVCSDINDIVKLTNKLAVEHVQIQCGAKSKNIAVKITNAGAIFVGEYCPVAVGDYWAGPSHTLPTEMRAKFSSALTSNDFVKSISIIEYDKGKLAESAEDIVRLAEAEGLDAHAKSVRIRQQD